DLPADHRPPIRTPNTQDPRPNTEGRTPNTPKGRVLDRQAGEKGRVLDRGAFLEKGRVLDRGETRAALAQALPPEVAALVKQPQYDHFIQLRLTLPVDDTDGEYLRLAVAVESTGGSVSDRQALRPRRPGGARKRGALGVLGI